MSEFEDRRDKADPAELIADPEERAHREAENGILQFEAALTVIRHQTDEAGGPFRLTTDLILDLHSIGLKGIHAGAGTFRTGSVVIENSAHVPPRHTEIVDLVDSMCEYVNERWYGFDATELAAYVLWRINWIHPFADGNGRVARIISYLILSTKIGYVLPGFPTIPEQIADDKVHYYRFLEEADNSWKRRFVAVSGMEAMLASMLERQLRGAALQGQS